MESANLFALGEANISDVDDAIRDATNGFSSFGTALKSIAVNMGIMLAITATVKLATLAWDEFNTTVAEVEGDLKNTRDTISDLKSQISELENVDANSLTQGQKDKLENLKEQLKVQEQLEEIEKRRLARETVGSGNWSDYFDKDSYKNAHVGIMKDLTEYQRKIDGLAPLYEKRSDSVKRKNVLVKAGEEEGLDVSGLEESLRKAEEEQEKTAKDILLLQESLISNKADIQAWINTIQGYISDGSLVGEDLTRANADLEVLSSNLEYVNKQLAFINNLVFGGDDSWENVLAEKTQYSLKNLRDFGFTDDELQTLASGKITFDKNATLDELRNLLDETQNVVDENPPEIKLSLSKSEMINTINSMSDGMDVLDDIYSDIVDGGAFDFTKLDTSKFSDAFLGLEPQYEKFIETVSAFPNDINRCQEAFNELTTAYIEQKGILSGVSEENKQLTIDMLENMGIANAEEVVMSALGISFEDYARAKREAFNAGIDLVNATDLEIQQLMLEDSTSRQTAQGLFLYQMQKALSNSTTLQTFADIENLKALGLSLGLTSELLDDFIRLVKIKNDISLASQLGDKDTVNVLTKEAEELTLSIKAQSAQFKATVKPMSQYVGAGKTASAMNDKLKDSAKKATEALEKQKKALEETKTEYEELHSAIIDYIDDEIEDIDDKTSAIEKQNEKLQEQLDIYDDIISAITNNIDVEIDAIDDKIDKLRDANDEEERALELEEARRKLQEARSRKTKLVYGKGVGFTYQTDSKNIKKQEEALANLEQDELIDSLEKEKDLLEENKKKWLEIADAREKALQASLASKYFGNNWRDTTLNPSDEMIDKLKGDYVGTQINIEQNDSRIEELNKEKEFWENEKKLWQDALDEYEKQQNRARLLSFFGSDYEHQLLNNSSVWRRKFADEYSSICAEIEALEERIKVASEETTKSVEDGANKVANSARTVGSSMDEMKEKYKWSQEDTATLEYATQRLDALNELIGQGKTELTDARDKVANFVDQYSKLEDSRIVTDDLRSSVEELNGVYGKSGDYLEQMASGITDRLNDSKNYTQELVQNTQTTVEQLGQVNEQIDALKTSEESIKDEAETTVSDIDTTVSNLASKLDELRNSLNEIKIATDEAEATVDEELLDTSTIVDGMHTKVSEIQSAISILVESITPLEGALDTLMEKLNTLDEVTLSGVIGAFGGASGSSEGGSKESGSKKSSSGKEGSSGGSTGGSGLISAVKAVDEAIGSTSDPESLLGKLQLLDDKTLEQIIAQFGLSGDDSSDSGNLLSSVNAVSDAIVGGKNDDSSLVASIDRLGDGSTLGNIDNVTNSFGKLLDKIGSCISEVSSLASKIASLPPVPSIGGGGGSAKGRAKGGIISKEDAGDFDYIAKAIGEDHTIAVQEGEAVIPKGVVSKNRDVIDALLSGGDLKSLVNKDVILRSAIPYGTTASDNWAMINNSIPELSLSSQNLSKFVHTNRSENTNININGNLSFPNIKSGNDAELLIKDLSNMANKARQRGSKR